jgi:hypothetical protein
MNNKVFAYPDLLMHNFVPQNIQLSLMANYVKKFDKSISFYTTEYDTTFKKLDFFKEKMLLKPEISGFVFFSLIQFCYENKMNAKLINKSIKLGYELFFVREKIYLKDATCLQKIKSKIANFASKNKKNININLEVKSF